MKFECYPLDGIELDIQPSDRRRGWMDQTPGAFAYRCLPLSIANAHGWEIRCSGTFEAEWNGGDRPEDVIVRAGTDGAVRAHGQFGGGVLTFQTKAIFRTPPGYNLWVTGPVNEFKDGIQALSACVETDWLPFTFTMNWKFTRPNTIVRFCKGDPYCFLFPVERGLLEKLQPEFRHIDEEPDLSRQYQYAYNRRAFFSIVRQFKWDQFKGLGPTERGALNWQRWYTKGELPDGTSAVDNHQVTVQVKPFTAFQPKRVIAGTDTAHVETADESDTSAESHGSAT